jgi:hypothetical protein
MAAEVAVAAQRRLHGEGSGSVAARQLWWAAQQQGGGNSAGMAVVAETNAIVQSLAS